MPLFTHVPHPRVRREPARVADQHAKLAGSRISAWLAVKITSGVGTMACAGVFAIIALVSLPSAIASGSPVIMVQWLSSVFLQLVLLSIILVGQRVQSAAADQRALDTYTDAESILYECTALQAHLAEQDKVLVAALDALQGYKRS